MHLSIHPIYLIPIIYFIISYTSKQGSFKSPSSIDVYPERHSIYVKQCKPSRYQSKPHRYQQQSLYHLYTPFRNHIQSNSSLHNPKYMKPSTPIISMTALLPSTSNLPASLVAELPQHSRLYVTLFHSAATSKTLPCPTL